MHKSARPPTTQLPGSSWQRGRGQSHLLKFSVCWKISLLLENLELVCCDTLHWQHLWKAVQGESKLRLITCLLVHKSTQDFVTIWRSVCGLQHRLPIYDILTIFVQFQGYSRSKFNAVRNSMLAGKNVMLILLSDICRCLSENCNFLSPSYLRRWQSVTWLVRVLSGVVRRVSCGGEPGANQQAGRYRRWYVDSTAAQFVNDTHFRLHDRSVAIRHHTHIILLTYTGRRTSYTAGTANSVPFLFKVARKKHRL